MGVWDMVYKLSILCNVWGGVGLVQDPLSQLIPQESGYLALTQVWGLP